MMRGRGSCITLRKKSWRKRAVKKALRDYVKWEQQAEWERPGIVFTLVMLVFEFFLVKELAFSPPYDIWKVAFGIFMLVFFWAYHWGAYRG